MFPSTEFTFELCLIFNEQGLLVVLYQLFEVTLAIILPFLHFDPDNVFVAVQR